EVRALRRLVRPLEAVLQAKLSRQPDTARLHGEERLRSALDDPFAVDLGAEDAAGSVGRLQHVDLEVFSGRHHPIGGGEPADAAADDRDSSRHAVTQPASIARSRTKPASPAIIFG